MARRVRLDHIMVNSLERGRCVGRIAGRAIVAEAAELVLSRLASPMDIVLEDATWLALIVPRNILDKHMPWPSMLDARVFGSQSVQAVILGGLLRSLCSLPDALPMRDATAAARSALALLTSCLGDLSPSTRACGNIEADLARSVGRFIADRLPDPDLGLDLICREFSISRSRLYRIMGERSDIAKIIRQLRLRGAQRDITSHRFAHLPLAAIGKRWGLLDERNFRRAFAQEFGYPPSLLRKSGSGELHSGAPEHCAVGADLERWFLGL